MGKSVKADEKQCSTSVANSLPTKHSEGIRHPLPLSVCLGFFFWGGTLILQKKSFPQSFESHSSSFLSTNMTTENVKFRLGLRWQNACLACRRPLAHPQDIWVHACIPTTWAVEAGRSEVQALSPGHLKVQKQPGIQETLFPKNEDKRAKFPATEFMPIPPKQKLLTGFQGTKKGRIWKTLYQMYGPIIKVVQS